MRVPVSASADVQQSFREVWAELDKLGAQGNANIDLHGRRIINAGDAVQQTDYVTKRQLTQAVSTSLRTAIDTGTGPPGAPVPFDDGGDGETGCTGAGADGHPTIVTLDIATAGQVICGTGNEYPALKAITVDQATRDANRDQLLDRMVWHMNLAGYPCSRYGTVAGRPWILLFNLPSNLEVAYRVVGYETFETPMTTVMVLGGASNEIVTPDAGIAD